MPIVFHVQPSKPRGARGQGFDAAIQRLAPRIAALQKGGCIGIEKLALALNQQMIVAPSGARFSYTTTRRVVRRLAQLGLCQAPLSSSKSRKSQAHTVSDNE
jgi:hypothetical protein